MSKHSIVVVAALAVALLSLSTHGLAVLQAQQVPAVPQLPPAPRPWSKSFQVDRGAAVLQLPNANEGDLLITDILIGGAPDAYHPLTLTAGDEILFSGGPPITHFQTGIVVPKGKQLKLQFVNGESARITFCGTRL